MDEAARILQLEPYLERRPKDLSGGQRQRVAIGRAIVRQPKVFLFDEPLSNLDAALRGQMRIELLRLHDELNATMIYVTHDQVEAMTMADKIVVLQAGRVEQVGSPLELYHHPANLFVAGFIGSPRMNLMEAKVVEADAGGASVSTPYGSRIAVPVESGAVRTGDAVTLGIRPEGLRLDPAGPIAATVALVERLGGLTLLHITAAGNQPMIVQIEGSDATRAARPDPARGRSRRLPPVRQIRSGPAATGPASAGRLTGGCMFLGLDFGTSAVKALLVDGEQAVVASATVPLSVQRPAVGHSEQDPEAWWQAMLDAVDSLGRDHAAALSAVAGIGLSGQMHGAVLLDGAGSVLRPAILWNDVRSAAECTELEEAVPTLRQVTGNIAMPGFTAPKLLWVRKHEPAVFAQGAHRSVAESLYSLPHDR